ncbi:MAG: cyclase family protein [Alphaproteobacteria bacterium]|jgi:kynurenine formamidase|nr:cyclase family protein [Alphaproteobacteria bacterium]
MTENRWTNRPEGSNWGDFGPDDRRGRLNLLTPEKVLEGVAEVRAGLSFCLSLPLDYPGGNVLNPRRHPPRLAATSRDGQANYVYPFSRENPDHTDVVCDDSALITLQYSTQWDSLAHVGSLFDADGDGIPEPVFYNGFRGGADIKGPPEAGGDSEAARLDGPDAGPLGIHTMAETGVQGRAVMIDLERHVGRERVLVGHDRLMAICAADGVVVEPGDMVCLHTGFADMILGMRRTPDAETLHKSCAALDGRDPELLRWVTESGLAVLIADNYAVEGFPSRPGAGAHSALPLHEHCLFKLGIHLGELFHLGDLAKWLRAHHRSRFLLTAPPLRLPGAAGSPVTAVGTV